MEFFFPDSQDQVNPLFDFETEEHPPQRVRQRDDRYAHEILHAVPYDGILISKSIVDESTRTAGKYTMAQAQRIYRLGVRRFFRVDVAGRRLLTMGDCGAFSYAEEPEPPFTVDEVIDFYDGIGLDRGVSVDHIVFGYNSTEQRTKGAEVDPEWKRRRELTLELAAEFLSRTRARKCRFEPVGVAHGWDPDSYADSVVELQRMGYRRISIGGLVPLKTPDIREVVRAIGAARDTDVQLHLLGVTRTEHIPEFAGFGVSSFDSTPPFRQAFKDETDNYYTHNERYTALRVPQVDGNTALKRRIRAGEVDQREAIAAERCCLETLRAFDHGDATVDDSVAALRAYELLYDPRRDRSPTNRVTLEAAPWKNCQCGICDDVGIEVILFRGSERNKRRGFHNLAVFRGLLDVQLRRIAAQRSN